MHHSRCDPGPRVVARLAFGDAASQSLGLGNYRWHDGVGVLGDRSQNFSLSGCDLFGCFLRHRQLMRIFRLREDLLLWS